jgi:hypothetical protein
MLRRVEPSLLEWGERIVRVIVMDRHVEAHLLNPPPGSAAARARDFGIDLTLLIERLRRTPEERLDDLQRVMRSLTEARQSAELSLRKTR